MKDTCETCRHFRQHYLRSGEKYHPAASGHCVYPRVKLRYVETPACGHYHPKDA